MSSIRKGAALLDQAYPEWYKAIDLDELDLESTASCVLGQLATDLALQGSSPYAAMAERLGFAPFGDEAEEYGFIDATDSDYPGLTRKWAAAIKRRLGRG